MKLHRSWRPLLPVANSLALAFLLVVSPSATMLGQKTRPTAKTTNANLQTLVDKLTHQDKAITFHVLKEFLPRNTVIEKPSWMEGDVATGNATEFSGELVGLAVFLNAQQREAIESGSVLTSEQTAFRDSDPLAYVQIYLADSTDQVPDSFAATTARMLDKTLEPDVANFRHRGIGGEVSGNTGAMAGVNEASKGRTNETREARGWISSWSSQRYSVDFWRYWYGRTFVVNIYLDKR
jgi:hypothetical protein